jgi:hypothetical protein
LNRRICLGDPRFSQKESHLVDKPLTLPHAQINAMKLFQVMRKELSIPKDLRVPKVSRALSQITMDGLPLGLA